MSQSKQAEPLCPMVVFSKLQQGNEWMDSDEVRTKTRQGADEHDRAPATVGSF